MGAYTDTVAELGVVHIRRISDRVINQASPHCAPINHGPRGEVGKRGDGGLVGREKEETWGGG